MIGVGLASGAITFVNALPTGIGSAAGIGLWATATVDLAPSVSEEIEVQQESDSPLVVATARAALLRWAPGHAFRARLRVRSDIPIAKGLKSSSAVGAAVGRAVASALGRTPSNEEIARLAADVAQEIGLSATGAFDDALAAVEPGIHVTDNAARATLRSDPVDPSWQVVLYLPRASTHAPSPEYLLRFRHESSEGRVAEEAARRGDPIAAMTANTRLVERVLEYSYEELRRSCLAAGAIAAGVSGMGPALAIIAPERRLDAIRAALPRGPADVLATRFTERPAVPTGRLP